MTSEVCTAAAPSPYAMNTGARFWRYSIGVPVIPANTKEKRPLVEWEKYQYNPPTDKEFQYWIDSSSFRNGLAIITGPVKHRPDKEGLYLVAIDRDKQCGIDKLLTREIKGKFKTITLEQAAKKWIVEQHKDNPNKAHFCFYSPIPFPDKPADSTLGIEVKSTSKHLLFVSPSIHKDGHPYEIIGTRDPLVLTELAARELIQHIDLICMKHRVPYLQGGKSSDNAAKTRNR